MPVPFAPFVFVAALAAIVAADRRIKIAAQPLRLHLAEKGERFLRLPNTPERARNHIKFILDHAFSMRALLLMAIIATPIIAILFALRAKSILRHTDEVNHMEPSAKAEFFEINRLHMRITLVNHWILFPLVQLEMLLFMPLSILIRTLIYGRVPEAAGGQESVIFYIENKRSHLRLKHSHAVASSR